MKCIGQLNSTVSVVFSTFASVTTVLELSSSIFVLPNIMQYENLSSLFILAAVIVFIRPMGSAALNFLRAQQRRGEVATTQIISRCINLVFVITLLFFMNLILQQKLVAYSLPKYLALAKRITVIPQILFSTSATYLAP